MFIFQILFHLVKVSFLVYMIILSHKAILLLAVILIALTTVVIAKVFDGCYLNFNVFHRNC